MHPANSETASPRRGLITIAGPPLRRLALPSSAARPRPLSPARHSCCSASQQVSAAAQWRGEAAAPRASGQGASSRSRSSPPSLAYVSSTSIAPSRANRGGPESAQMTWRSPACRTLPTRRVPCSFRNSHSKLIPPFAKLATEASLRPARRAGSTRKSGPRSLRRWVGSLIHGAIGGRTLASTQRRTSGARWSCRPLMAANRTPWSPCWRGGRQTRS
mmetsp:Transcript_148086/g.369202  ORF Transcript_148086/g.369202 Transcript_148086/m.369202 type:complete len:217 (-) Transcript_148086:403-1053(-)